MAADREAYRLVAEKAAGMPWSPPSDYSLHPAPTSRLYDPTPLDDPWLPMPAPQLYAYRLPELPPREGRQHHAPQAEPIDVPQHPVPEVQVDDQTVIRLPQVNPPNTPNQPVQLASAIQSDEAAANAVSHAALRWVDTRQPGTNNAAEPPLPSTGPSSAESDRAVTESDSPQSYGSGEVLLNPIPQDAWEAVPVGSRTRMYEFEKLRQEYRRTFGDLPSPEQFAPGQRLALEDIVQLALLNSREYQTQKEILYRVALQLSLERFAYQLKFSPVGNGTAVNWNHTRVGGETVNGLSIPTRFQIEKMLVTGGDFLARFANDVILTFNGPTGFAADVGSDLFFEFDQTIFQRDVRFESLTQAERNLVYAARDFARFRKTLFNQLASQYYNLIRTYRQVEIDSQNYFTLVRAFHQSQAEYGAGLLPRFQLDQVEQNVLSGRSRLIATCNNLESALDNLKIRMGLPSETHININLSELEELTARDELAVTGQLIRRVRRRLIEERDRTDAPPSRVVLLSSSIVLIERMLESQRLQERVGMPVAEQGDLPGMLRRLQVEAARETVAGVRADLQAELQNQPPSAGVVFLRSLDLIRALLDLAERQLDFAQLVRPGHPGISEYRRQIASFRERADVLEEEQGELVESGRSAELPQLVERTEQTRANVEALIQELDRLLGTPLERPMPDQQLQESLREADELLTRSEALLQSLGTGLTPVEIEMDDAMLTALNLRFDLMNQRGDVADAWRQIKYAGDDLKAVLNINASHRISTRADVNRVFDFTFDESDTRVRATFDAPFNRRSQRNVYRQSLINYQSALRQLMQLEDNVKLDVRNDLRSLALGQEQYAIEVASAALAYERVVSVLLELRLGIGRVAARDFLEAQNAYASSLSNVASRHIGYIIDRTQLFFDLELLTVDDDGFWNQLYDEAYQPEPFYQLPGYALPVYGELVPGLWYSKYIRRMEDIPPGKAAVHEEHEAQAVGEVPMEGAEGMDPQGVQEMPPPQVVP